MALKGPSCLVPRLRLSGRVCLSSPCGGDLQGVCHTPSSRSPRRGAHFSLGSLISGLPSPPSFPIHFLWGNDTGARSVPMASVRSSHKSEISNGAHSPSLDLSITTCEIITGQSSWTQPSALLFPFMAFYPHEVKTQNCSFPLVPESSLPISREKLFKQGARESLLK